MVAMDPCSPMRIIFTDFDGVLHATSGPAASMRQFVWLPQLLQLLEGHGDVRLVIHASARQSSPGSFLVQRLGAAASICLGVTDPKLARWPSIAHWLSSHPEVRRFCILDDMPSEFPKPAPAELIVCDGRTGVSSPEIQEQLRQWLVP